MRLKLISCEVFVREACLAVAGSHHIVDPEFTPKGAHEQSDFLRQMLQEKIDEAERSDRGYEAILLGFGLCGNSILGLHSKNIPLVIPRAHDCCTLFLGSREKFVENFADRLSSEWTSVGYLERGESYIRELDMEDSLGNNRSYQELVDQYGEDNASYIWDTLHPDLGEDKIIYIEVPEFAFLNCADRVKAEAEKEGKSCLKIEGNMRLIDNLIKGRWPEEDFLIVEPGRTIKAVYDHERVITS